MRCFLRVLTIVAIATALLAVPALPQAQSRVTCTIAEQGTNNHRLPLSVRRFVSAVNVDLKAVRQC
jgi:hypothetical protein